MSCELFTVRAVWNFWPASSSFRLFFWCNFVCHDSLYCAWYGCFSFKLCSVFCVGFLPFQEILLGTLDISWDGYFRSKTRLCLAMILEQQWNISKEIWGTHSPPSGRCFWSFEKLTHITIVLHGAYGFFFGLRGWKIEPLNLSTTFSFIVSFIPEVFVNFFQKKT